MRTDRAVTTVALLLTLGAGSLAYGREAVVSIVHAFHPAPDNPEGSRPGTVAVGSDGSLYGTTAAGGTNGAGTIFRINRGGRFETLYNFKGYEGSQPNGCLLPGADGNFYGIIGSGGNVGTFRITPTGELRVLGVLRLKTAPDDDWSTLVKGSDGRLYSISNAGDPSFELTRLESEAKTEPVYNIVHAHVIGSRFVGLNAAGLERERAEVGQSIAGTTLPLGETLPVLCGTTIPTHDGHLWTSPPNSTGLVRSISRNVEDGFYPPESVLPRRTPIKDVGATPNAQALHGAIPRFAEATDGTLWAVSGHIVDGTRHYEIIAVSTSGEIQRHIPLEAVGSYAAPAFGLVRAHNGYFYGLVQGYAGEASLLYGFDSTGSLTIIHRFNEAARGRIAGPLIMGSDGSLYVTFIDGGESADGVIFRIEL